LPSPEEAPTIIHPLMNKTVFAQILDDAFHDLFNKIYLRSIPAFQVSWRIRAYTRPSSCKQPPANACPKQGKNSIFLSSLFTSMSIPKHKKLISAYYRLSAGEHYPNSGGYFPKKAPLHDFTPMTRSDLPMFYRACLFIKPLSLSLLPGTSSLKFR